MDMNYGYFLIGVVAGIAILYYESALPPPFNHIGFRKKGGTRLRIFGRRIHHSTIGVIGILLASILSSLDKRISQIILGVSLLFLISQIPEILQHGTLFWEDNA